MSPILEGIRYLLAIYFFCLGFYLVADLIFKGFNLAVLLGVAASFWLAHIVKPKDRREETGESDIYDIIDLVTGFPYRIVATFLRGMWRSRGGSRDSDGIDFDD